MISGDISMKRLSAAVALTLLSSAPALAADDAKSVLKTYGDIAQAMYEDALTTAEALDKTVDALIASPSDTTLAAARTAWKAARVPYQQTEGYRFGNAVVDEWEGKVNSWPLDEGLIDYVDPSYGDSSDANPLYTLNVIAHPSIRIGSKTVDASKITPALLESLQEADDVEANVATGYHAIEFLLWGQDLHGTGPGAGERSASDYDTKACTHGNCDRRAAYLKSATTLLVTDLKEMAGDWAPGGAARADLAKKGDKGGLATILTGLGSLSYGELAGERMKLGLILHDPEEEQDCFSDNTHNSHYYDELGMNEIWAGSYTRIDGSKVEGPSLKAYAEAKAKDKADALTRQMAEAKARIEKIKVRADSGVEAYDQMIGAGNKEGNKLVSDAIDGLIAQTRAVEAVVAALGLSISVEGSDSLDNPSAVTAN